MSDSTPLGRQDLERYESAEVIFLTQDGYRLAPARVRCYSFAGLLRRGGMRAEVLSFHDHLGASAQGVGAIRMTDGEKLALNLRALDILDRNPRAVLYLQKAGYHALAPCMAAVRNGNPLIFDYDDHEMDLSLFAELQTVLPCLHPTSLVPALAARSASCVASSHDLERLLSPHNRNTHLIHTVADPERFHTRDRDQPRRRFGEAVNIIWCGDVWGELVMRDILFAVDAFAMIPADVRARACLHVVGFGAAWEDLRRRLDLRHRGLTGLRLHEHIPPAEFGAVLAEMDIGLLPYHDNPFNAGKSPTKMFEFMLAGVAVCATPVGEATRCLAHGETALFGRGLAAFSANLETLIADAGTRRGIAARAAALGRERFSLDGIAGPLAGIVRAALARAPGAAPPDRHALAGTAIRDGMGRRFPVTRREVDLALADVARLLAEPDTVPERRITAPLIALLRWPGLEALLGIAPEVREAGLNAALARRPGRRLFTPAGAGVVPGVAAGEPALSKLCAAEDWEDSHWLGWAARYKTGWTAPPFEGDVTDTAFHDTDRYDTVYNHFKRSRGVWERTQIVQALDRLGALRPTSRILVISRTVDGLYLFLSERVARVCVVDIGPEREHTERLVAGGSMDPWLLRPRQFRREVLEFHHGALPADDRDGGSFDAVLLPGNAAFEDGAARCATILAWATGRLRAGGVLALAAEVGFGPVDGRPWLSHAATRPNGLGELVAEHTGFRFQGPFDAFLSEATLDRVALTATGDVDHPHLARETDGVLHANAVWTFVKDGVTAPEAWARVAAELSALGWLGTGGTPGN